MMQNVFRSILVLIVDLYKVSTTRFKVHCKVRISNRNRFFQLVSVSVVNHYIRIIA